MIYYIKRISFIRFLCRAPGFFWLYHFLWAAFAALIYGSPSKKIFVIGVTGTKGKTTVLELLNAILEGAGKKTALLSSLRIKIDKESRKNKTGNTMPGRFYLQRFLSRAARAGCGYALMEITSEGVTSHRHRFINWNAGILTNIAPEHIEAHGSFEKYRAAKLSFLKYAAKKGGRVFINKDASGAEFFAEKLRRFQPAIFSKNDREILHAFPSDLPLRGAIDEHAFPLSDFNRENAAVAVAVALHIGIGIKAIEQALRNFKGVPGRMEFIRSGGITAVVDYAHTPDSLRKVYTFLKESGVCA